jgi:hypothetical protein
MEHHFSDLEYAARAHHYLSARYEELPGRRTCMELRCSSTGEKICAICQVSAYHPSGDITTRPYAMMILVAHRVRRWFVKGRTRRRLTSWNWLCEGCYEFVEGNADEDDRS